MTTYELQETCCICDRVRWGNYQYLGKGKWRHAECAPGSHNWREYYMRLPEAKRTSAGNLLFNSKEGN